MEDKLLEGVKLQNTTLSLNPEDLKRFDDIVGKQNRSAAVRDMIRQFIRIDKATRSKFKSAFTDK